ncbi:MAG: bifunctional precorrin-2 dehydrogenase/sirohydrochlorin ferrochelatase [Chitinispirillaceae bacterium]|nr:bifunctional precorrin-2 dehydrogenase/sirohydrochlorin ferrochelatase [Chitinispirillaceae bacterium]
MLYPVFLNVKGKKCLVIGAGRVALRKIITLLKAEANITVIAENSCKLFNRIEKYVSFQKKKFEDEDITKEYFIVIGATNSKEVNERIYKKACELNIPCNIVDQPQFCTFIVPSVVRKGKITIAISTEGTSPRFTRYVKGKISEAINPMYEELLLYLGELREKVKRELPNSKVRSKFWEKLFTEDPIEKIKEIGEKRFKEEIESLLLNFHSEGAKR